MKEAHLELGHRLTALRADFAALSTRAADAAGALAATLPPPAGLLEEFTTARVAFTELRAAMLDQAGALALVLDAERLGTLRDLEPVLAAITSAEERRARVAAWEEAREESLLVLDRVMALIHRDDKDFAPLEECQAKARDLHRTLAGSVPDDLAHETTMLSGRLRAFAELMALIEGWHVLDDDRCAFLQDAITLSFGRPLALAALRGKLGREGELPPEAPEPRARGRAPAPPGAEAAYPPAAYPAAPVGAPAAATAPGPMQAAPPVMPGVPAPPGAVSPAYAAGTGAPGMTGGAPAGGVFVGGGGPGIIVTGGGAAGGGVVAGGGGPGGMVIGGGGQMVGGGGSLVVEIRLSGDKVSVETPEARREREELLERLAQETAQWWIAARNGWTALREGGQGFADAARQYIERFPYLLSVPLQQSAEHLEGRLAEGYALLLAHIEKQEEGFVKEALTRLNPQFTTREKDQAYPLGQELYLYVVAEGRLYKTYPDFVREVFVNALPEPGPWVQGGIRESDGETTLFMRGETPGSTEEDTRTVTGFKERIGPHLFNVTLGPLTTRFFTIRLAGETLADPPNVEIKVKENEAPTDHAWLVTLPPPGKTQALAPRKHRTGGVTLEELGKGFSGLWIGVFNADPSNDRRYELSVTLRRKPPDVPRPGAKAAAASAPSKFFGKRR